ncbi:hypothetical protein ACNFBT_06330 [Pseudomonas sp. NY15181]|uniref:hypothetical protein n=1 Tax=Pseudomonas sp. NY15181 TaxID=3400349 RepID=UPI003A8406B4
MLLRRTLPILLFAPLCGLAFGDEPTATEACLNLAHRTLIGTPEQAQRWQELWVDARLTREDAYDGEVEGQRVDRRLHLVLRRDSDEDGILTCFLQGKNQAISAQFQAKSDAP